MKRLSINRYVKEITKPVTQNGEAITGSSITDYLML